MSRLLRITSPDDPALDPLCDRLAAMSVELDRSQAWPAEQLRLCGQVGVYEWFGERHWGGQEWSDLDLMRGYLRLSAACLTTTFIITQRSGAYQRIAASSNEVAKARLLPGLISGETFATVGISHLTTSRRHLGHSVLRASESGSDFILDGYSPWVTGGLHAQTITVGAALDNRLHILLALPTNLKGVTVPDPPQLVGLSASHTGEVRLDKVWVSREWLLAGPADNVVKVGTGGGAASLQTSALALGLAQAALDFLAREADKRPDLVNAAEELRREHRELVDSLVAMITGAQVCTNDQLRASANSLVLRSTQAALAAAKGSGYVVGHPAGRWCREALFFLVWSCPQGVMNANLCELAGLESSDGG
jgi:alkylation response protein AidB-like acyl-CoA dehydrogenase